METTTDAFLGGRLQVRQPASGYRAGADPVLLAAAVPVQADDQVLELGCGAGVAMLCLLAREPSARVTGVDRDAGLLALARENAALNGVKADLVEADIAALPTELRFKSYDHVIANPPFFDRRKGIAAADRGRESGRGEETELSTWVNNAVRRLRPGGRLTLVQRVERLPECIAALDDRVGDTVILPFAPRIGREAKIFILQTKKGGRGDFRLLSPLVLHDGETHEKDGEDYSQIARRVLREGQALPLGDSSLGKVLSAT